MTSFFMKKWIGNEFDKVVKEFTGDDDKIESNGMSGEDLVAEENQRAAEEKERKARQEKTEKEREEARQKIRDKYNIKKKDESPTTNKKHEPNKINDSNTRIERPTTPQSQTQSFDPMKMTTDAFNNIKRKFGW